jgi:hypothetical protein
MQIFSCPNFVILKVTAKIYKFHGQIRLQNVIKYVNQVGVVLVEYITPSAQLMCVHNAEGQMYTYR